MKIKTVLILLPTILLFSCSKKQKLDKLHFYQDFESLTGWVSSPNLTENPPAHSGVYCSATTKQNQYSHTLNLPLQSVSIKPIKKIKASAWCYYTSKNCEGGLCIQVVDSTNNNKFWLSSSLKDFVKEPGKWTKVTAIAEFKGNENSIENIVKIFVWNTGNDKVLVDDFEVEFVE